MIPPLWTPLSIKAKWILRLAAMALITIACLVLAWFIIDRYAPPQDVPWKPLDLALPPGMATSGKLVALAKHPADCFERLATMGIEVTRLTKPASTNPQCRVDAALTLDRSLTPYTPTLQMSCPLAAGLYIWERHVVLPQSELILGSRVTKIETFGAWSCRRVNHQKEGRWSEHASGQAVDIAGFWLADGRHITVKKHFRDTTPEGNFLRTIRSRACDVFRATLSPDYNAAHADHFHLDLGDWKACR